MSNPSKIMEESFSTKPLNPQNKATNNSKRLHLNWFFTNHSFRTCFRSNGHSSSSANLISLIENTQNDSTWPEIGPGLEGYSMESKEKKRPLPWSMKERTNELSKKKRKKGIWLNTHHLKWNHKQELLIFMLCYVIFIISL